MNIRNLAKKLPYPIKHGQEYASGIIPLSIRHGKVFRDTYKFLQESQWWSREKLEDYQMWQLNKLIHHAYDNVLYYRNLFDEKGLKPRDIRDFDDLRKLPYLTKDIMRNNLSDLIAQNYSKRELQYAATSGSSGVPLWFYLEKKVSDPKERAFVWRQWNWAGYKLGQRRVILRGNLINRFRNRKRQWWEYKPANNTLILSSYDMTKEKLTKYIDKIKTFRPVAIQGYPSSLYILANFLKNRCSKLRNIKCILTSSEKLYRHQKETIEAYLGGRIYDLYGNTEASVLIMQCEKGRYHIMPEYGITELIGEDGNPVNEDGKIGEIVGTGFNNLAVPFIRYRTGDLGIYTQEKCSCCRQYQLIKGIEGRSQEFFIAKDGDLISLGDMQIYFVFDNVKQFQFYQEEKGKATFKIVKKDTYSEKDTQRIEKALEARFGERIDLKIRFVDNIPRTKSGKYRFLIQKLQIDFGD